MSVRQFSALRATAMHTATALARYERHVRRLAATWLDMELYQTVSREMDAIRADCALIPELSVPATALLISHAELVHTLLHGGEGQRHAEAERKRCLDEHLACIDALARRCLRLGNPPGSSSD